MIEEEPYDIDALNPDEQSLDEFDDQMKHILSQLDDSDPDSEFVDKMECSVPEYDTAPFPPLMESPDAGKAYDNPLPDVSELTVSDVRRASPVVQPSELMSVVTSVESTATVDLKKQFEQMESVTDEILQGTRSDRQEAQDVINLLRLEIDKSIASNGHPPRMYIDNIVKALEVKSTINMTAVKIMEAKAKLLAATKAGVQIQNNQINNTQVGSDDSLTDILAVPLNNEDEY